MILTTEDYREMASQVSFGENCEEFNMVEFEKDGIYGEVCLTAAIYSDEDGDEISINIESVEAWDCETNKSVEIFFNSVCFEDEVREAA